MPIKPLIEKVKSYNPQADTALLEKAYRFARDSHRDQYRKSGEDFILHPLAVAEILAGLEMDTTTLVAALLHDVVEDVGIPLPQITEKFGQEVSELIDGVTKLSKLRFRSQEEVQAENLRKMFLAMAKDIRVILIKLADRMHNLQTLSHVPKEKQKEKARETLDIYAPLAHRLGIYQLKWQLEDLAFAALEPAKYKQIQKMVLEKRQEREDYLEEVIETIKQELERLGVKNVDITGRAKHFYSIYEKMRRKEKEFFELFDLMAIRVLVDSVRDCYGVLGAIHALWKPVPGRFKDYIAMPKFNMYQSLHTTVIGPKGRPLEIQIRTFQMHRTAEYGIAAHWRYKEGVMETDRVDERLDWFRQMLEWQTELKDPREFMEALKIDLFKDEVFVFTPKGDVISLPAGSTPLDFAYAIHTDVGNKCVGAKINNKIVSLGYQLQMGDIIEIMTSKSSPGPSQDWLSIVHTSRARTKIRQFLSKEIKEDSAHLGKEELTKLLRKHGLTLRVALGSQVMEKIAASLNFQKIDDLYASIGAGKTSPKHVVTRIINTLARETPDTVLKDEKIELPLRPLKRPSPSGVKIKGIEDVLIRLAHCCNPVPGDEIIGFVTRGRGVSVHRKDCPNIDQLMGSPDRMLEVFWDVKLSSTFQVEIQVEAIDRTKLLRDISTVISDAGVNIVSASVNTTKESLAIFRFVFEIGNLAHLKNIIEEVKQIDAVFDAYRI